MWWSRQAVECKCNRTCMYTPIVPTRPSRHAHRWTVFCVTRQGIRNLEVLCKAVRARLDIFACRRCNGAGHLATGNLGCVLKKPLCHFFGSKKGFAINLYIGISVCLPSASGRGVLCCISEFCPYLCVEVWVLGETSECGVLIRHSVRTVIERTSMKYILCRHIYLYAFCFLHPFACLIQRLLSRQGHQTLLCLQIGCPYQL